MDRTLPVVHGMIRLVIVFGRSRIWLRRGALGIIHYLHGQEGDS